MRDDFSMHGQEDRDPKGLGSLDMYRKADFLYMM